VVDSEEEDELIDDSEELDDDEIAKPKTATGKKTNRAAVLRFTPS
jgi:hypothetical protein